jgi:predicted PurR-regulated permease PerM
LAIAILAGLARLVPYVGPAITWTILLVVTFFQRDNYFNLQPWQYSLMVLVICIITDQIFDQIISPRLLGDIVGVHPAAVLIGAIIATNLIGIVGLVLVTPVLASLKLLGGYAFRMMLDMDPWQAMEEESRRRAREPAVRLFRRVQAWMRMIREKIT